MKKYICEFSSVQLKVIQDALELFSRVKMGQLESVAEPINLPVETSPDEVHRLRNGLGDLKSILGLTRNGHLGIANRKCGLRAHTAWDLSGFEALPVVG